jgi:hypothetical protein
VMGGHNRTIATHRGSPIAGRQAWSGNSGGFMTTVVNVPAFQTPAGTSGWPAITAVPAKAGGLIRSVSLGAIRWARATLAPRRHHAPALRTAKPSRYACVYSGTSPKPVIADGTEL